MGFSVQSKEHFFLEDTAVVVSKTMPSGNYVLFVTVQVSRGFADVAEVSCSMGGSTAKWAEYSGMTYAALSFTTALSHQGGPIEVTCTEQWGEIVVGPAILSGIMVGALG